MPPKILRQLYNAWLYDTSNKTKYKGKNRHNRKKKKKINSRLQMYANQLNENLPKSEVWFHEYYKDYIHKFDLLNSVFGTTIPDVINRMYKYVIEIDGTMHNTERQKLRDIEKNAYYKKQGYSVFRIIAYDNTMRTLVVDTIKDFREKHPNRFKIELMASNQKSNYAKKYKPSKRTKGFKRICVMCKVNEAQVENKCLTCSSSVLVDN